MPSKRIKGIVHNICYIASKLGRMGRKPTRLDVARNVHGTGEDRVDALHMMEEHPTFCRHHGISMDNPAAD